jgi:acyl carrier protein
MIEGARPDGYDETLRVLKDFLEERFLPEGETGLEPASPLLEWGILTSLTTTELISFISERFRLTVPPEQIVGSNFKNLDAVTRMVLSLEGPMSRT